MVLFGSQNGQDHSGEVIDNVSDVTFFSNDTLKNQTLELWKVVAARYAGNPAVAAYDTLNEPGEKQAQLIQSIGHFTIRCTMQYAPLTRII